MIRRALLFFSLLLLPIAASAQEHDGTVLSRFLENQLSSGPDRQVEITGFSGALSSEATLERLTISDADGVWLILEDARLDWNRARVLRGEIDITELSAARLELIRRPLPTEPTLADTEAQPFALPDLPVSLELERLDIAEVVLREAVAGHAATFSVEGSAELSGGDGAIDIVLERLDGPDDRFEIGGNYSNETRNLSVNLLLEEEPGGLVGELLNLPDRPALVLSVGGDGPIDDFSALISLATDGRDRVEGTLTTDLAADGERTTRLMIGGDISPLLLAEFRPFFGDDVQLAVLVRQPGEGGVILEDLALTSAALTLDGSLSLDANNLPELVDLTASITPPDQAARVRLPAGDVTAEIAAAALAITYDHRHGDAYSLTAELTELTVDDLRVPSADLSLDGVVAVTGTQIDAITGALAMGLMGLTHTDPALAEALGPSVDLSGMLSWVNGAPVILSDLVIAAGDVTASGGASGQRGENTLDIALQLAAQVGDLDRFAPIAGQPLDGSAALNITGTVEALSQSFDLTISGTGQDLRVAEAVPAEIFAGRTDLSLAAERNTEGLFVRDLRLESAELSLTGDVDLSSGDSAIRAAFRLDEVGYFTDLLSGPVTADADIARSGTEPFNIDLNLRGPNDIAADIVGTFDEETGDITADVTASARDLDLGTAVPPQLLAGLTEIQANVARADGVLTVTGLNLSNAELNVTGTASIGPDTSDVQVNARLRNAGLFVSALSGAVTAEATLSRGTGPIWDVRANLGGPGGMRADVTGQVGSADGSVNLSTTGSAPLALANQFIAPRSIQGTLNFNLGINGRPGLQAVSGTLSAQGARISDPTFAAALQNVNVSGQLSNGRLRFNGGGQVSTGGQVDLQGNINLASPGLNGQVDIDVANARLVDPTLYEARIARADLTVSGALLRRPQITGDVTLGESEIRVPETGLGGSAAIPNITFVGESRDVRLTRSFAGLLGRPAAGGGGGAGGGGFSLGLDINVSAPGRIFLRGRGIDVELNGTIRLFGSAANVIPTGQFNLVRGRLSVLGTRLDFVEGQVTLQGSFIPFLDLAAVSRQGGYTITISVDGPALDPEITFSSNPFLPEDEVLAQLIFGRSVSNLSPLQLLQLADAATSLAGGSSNSGLIAGLRDGLGLDDLDFSTDDAGNAEVTAGRYLSENIYSDVTVNAEGETDLSLNIDLTPNITARGGVGSDGSSSIGIFFEQDY